LLHDDPGVPFFARGCRGRWGTLLAAVLVWSTWFGAAAGAAPVAIRYDEAPAHAFVVLTDTAGKTLAGGELVQWRERRGLTNRLVFHFYDGSLWDETVRFTAGKVLRLLSYHQVQRGPSFPGAASEVRFDQTGRYDARTTSAEGVDERDAGTVELPADVYNGMTSTLLKNLGSAAATVHLLALTPKPTLLELSLTSEGTDRFWVGPTAFTATRFLVTPKVTGAKGVVATVIGKQPEPVRFWMTTGNVPAFVRFEGSLYVGGPTWRIELTSARWKR
jgi:hypothetical protein